MLKKIFYLGVGYATLYGLIIALQFHWTPGFAPRWGHHLMLGAAQSTLLLLLTLLAYIFLSRKIGNYLPSIMAILLTFDVIYILLGGKGIMTGKTFDAAILAVFLPWLRPQIGKWWPNIILILWLSVILVYGEGTAYAVLLTHFITYIVRNPRFIFPTLLVGGATLAVGDFLHGAGLYSSDSRLFMWANYMDWWLANAPKLIGTGPGSFEWLGPLIPLTKESTQYYWMHNDWLQILFEYGIIGLVLSVFLYAALLWDTRREVRKQSYLIGLGVCMCFYSPLHLWYVAIFTGYMILRRPSVNA